MEEFYFTLGLLIGWIASYAVSQWYLRCFKKGVEMTVGRLYQEVKRQCPDFTLPDGFWQ